SAALWIALPFAAIPLFDPRFHERYIEQFLPQALGLTALGDFPSTTALAASAYLLLRARRVGGDAPITAAGLTTGFAIAIKPANGLFLVAVAITLALT